jgi:hypothetical protein
MRDDAEDTEIGASEADPSIFVQGVRLVETREQALVVEAETASANARLCFF